MTAASASGHAFHGTTIDTRTPERRHLPSTKAQQSSEHNVDNGQRITLMGQIDLASGAEFNRKALSETAASAAGGTSWEVRMKWIRGALLASWRSFRSVAILMAGLLVPRGRAPSAEAKPLPPRPQAPPPPPDTPPHPPPPLPSRP